MINQNKEIIQTDFQIDDNRYMIVGLGNIGNEYNNTRHNVGFMIVDRILEINNIDPAREETKFFGDFQRFSYGGNKFFVLKPSTFMNESGRAVKALSKYYDIVKQNIIVIHDDLDIDFGNIKYNFSKGPREHNGIKSIESYIGSEKFWRVRYGIESRAKEIRHKFKGRDFVLSRFSKEEIKLISETSVDIWDKISQDIVNTNTDL